MTTLCPHCGQTHPSFAVVCPDTGRPISRRQTGSVPVFLIMAVVGLGLMGSGMWMLWDVGTVLPAPVSNDSTTVAQVSRSPRPPALTNTAAPQRTSTLRATATATQTPRPTLTNTPTPTPTTSNTPITPTLIPSATPVAVACAITPAGAYANLWSKYQAELGCPKSAQLKFIQDAEQLFQNGHMFWRGDVDVFYVVYDGGGATQGGWARYAGKYNEGGLVNCPDNPPTGLVKPIRGFGNVWCGLGGTNAGIGWALDQEYGFSASNGSVRAQDFEKGVIFQDSDGVRRGLVYMLFNTGAFIRNVP